MAYWQKRQEAAYKAGELTVNQYFTKLEKAFNQAKRELQKTVESFLLAVCRRERTHICGGTETPQ